MATRKHTGSHLSRVFSRSSTLSDDVDSFIHTPDPPTISSLYGDAAEFEKVLVHSGCIDSRCPDKNGSNGFADLVGQDLNKSEQAAAGRLTRLSATQLSWTSSDDTDTSEESEGEELFADGPVIHRVKTDDDDPWKLEPAEIIDLLVEEFGPLAADGEEEKLVLEIDGCLIYDALIIVSCNL